MLKWVGLALGVAVLAGALGAWWMWDRATTLPEWYDDSATAPLTLPEDPAEDAEVGGWAVVPDRESPVEPAQPRAQQPAPSRRRELRNFHIEAVAGQEAFREAVRGSRAVYEDGHLEAGVVIDTGRIPRDQLEPEARKLHDRALRVFPGVRDRRIYLGIEDDPVTGNGYLQLGRSPQIRVGALTYSLDAAAKKLHISPRRLRREVNGLFRQLKLVDPDGPPPQ